MALLSQFGADAADISLQGRIIVFAILGDDLRVALAAGGISTISRWPLTGLTAQPVIKNGSSINKKPSRFFMAAILTLPDAQFSSAGVFRRDVWTAWLDCGIDAASR